MRERVVITVQMYSRGLQASHNAVYKEMMDCPSWFHLLQYLPNHMINSLTLYKLIVRGPSGEQSHCCYSWVH